MLCRTIKKIPYYKLITPVWKSQAKFYSKEIDSGMYLQDKVVLITGAGSGIGASAAMAFAKEGSKVVIVDRDAENMKRVAKYCEEKFCAKTLLIKADLTEDEEIKPMISKIIDKFGQLDVLVNNAGILTFGSILKGDLMEPYDRTLSINLRASVYITVLAAPWLVKTKGNIINVSSVLGRTYAGHSKYMPYCISKAGLDHFMYGAALELATVGVRVNNICPGPTKTDIFSRAGVKGTWKEIGDSFKVDNVSEPEEIADLIVYLASHKARSITGVRYYIDKGTLLMG